MTDAPEPIPAWYLAWASAHCTAFALRGDAVRAVLAWAPLFTRLFDEADLRAATQAMLADPADLQWVQDHRRKILEVVDAARNAERTRRRAEGGPKACGTCDGTGWALVPHPGTVPGTGHLVWPLRVPRADLFGFTRTLAVTCTCEAGERTATAETGRNRRPLSLAAYSSRYPEFNMIDYERHQMVLLARTPLPDDPDFRAVVERLVANTRPPAGQNRQPPSRPAAGGVESGRRSPED